MLRKARIILFVYLRADNLLFSTILRKFPEFLNFGTVYSLCRMRSGSVFYPGSADTD